MGYKSFDLRRTAGALGAKIVGIDLAKTIDDEVIADIRQALLDHQVIFFHDQHLTPQQHLAFGRRFGDLNVHEFVGGMEDVALLADLLSLPGSGRYPSLDLTPQRQKEKTFEALLRQLAGLARQQPVLMIF